MLHRFATFVAGCTVLLVLAGSFVTSTGSGLSVPDWPTTYGWNMFSFPPSKWVGGIFYEHGHRLIASTVGFLTIVLAAWLWRADPRRWMRGLGMTALAAVILQGVLGGLTVLFFLPAPVSTAHAALAEIFFCLTVAIALCTSPGWIRGDDLVDDPTLRRVTSVTTVLVFVQILVGATMRHTDAGLAIPDFPWMFGHILPDHWDLKIAVHFAHRVGALVVSLSTLVAVRHIWASGRSHSGVPPPAHSGVPPPAHSGVPPPAHSGVPPQVSHRGLSRPAALLVALVVTQVTLGALTVLSRRDEVVNSLHVVCGALVLATSLVITLRSWRVRFAIETISEVHRVGQPGRFEQAGATGQTGGTSGRVDRAPAASGVRG